MTTKQTETVTKDEAQPPTPPCRAIFSVGYMESNEQEEMERMAKPHTTCWYCGRNVCNLTHKYEPVLLAVRPDDSPYAR